MAEAWSHMAWGDVPVKRRRETATTVEMVLYFLGRFMVKMMRERTRMPMVWKLPVRVVLCDLHRCRKAEASDGEISQIRTLVTKESCLITRLAVQSDAPAVQE